jgi:hypothetical protein
MPMLLILLTSVGLSKKKKDAPVASSEETAAETKDPVDVAEVPKDGTSKKYAKRLLTTEFQDFDANIMGLVWHKLVFSTDNTFEAIASQSLMDESLSCIERGTWTMDPASSSTVTNLTLKIEEGDCPAADVPRQMRIQATLNGSKIDAKYR